MVKSLKMFMLMLLIFVVVLSIGHVVVSRKFNIQMKLDNRTKAVKIAQTTGMMVILVGYTIVLYVVLNDKQNFTILPLVFIYFGLITLFRMIMEWAYNRRAKRWIAEIYSLIVVFLFYLVLLTSGTIM